MRKLVFQCAGSKKKGAGTFELDGRKVIFVSRPELCPELPGVLFARPDDRRPDSGQTWRNTLLEYNLDGGNPRNLLKAKDLYENDVYRNLADDKRWEFFILSAGWGLIKADFMLPPYDITFSRAGKYAQRSLKRDAFDDFNQMTSSENDEIVFIGGKEYLNLFYNLTSGLPGKKIVYHASDKIDAQSGFEYERYRKKCTNWQYECAKDFLRGVLLNERV